MPGDNTGRSMGIGKRRTDMDKIYYVKSEIQRLIEMNKTKNGFPAGVHCAIRIEAYERLLEFINNIIENND